MSEQEFTCEEELEALKERCKELEEALRKEIQWKTATDLRSASPQIWLPVMNLVEIFHTAYQIRNNALANNKLSTKLIFTVSNEGRIVDVSSSASKPEEIGT